MIVIQNVKVPHTFKLDPYKNVACNPSPTCIAGVPIPGVGCCPEELVDKEEAPKVGDEEEEEEKKKKKLPPTNPLVSTATSDTTTTTKTKTRKRTALEIIDRTIILMASKNAH